MKFSHSPLWPPTRRRFNQNMLPSKDKIKKYIERESVSWMKVLMPAYLASLLAPLYYFFDLFSHFTIQYVIGGFILGSTLLYFKRWRWACVAFAIMLICGIESRIHLQEPLRTSPPQGIASFTIASYNQNVGQSNFAPLLHFLSQKENAADVIILVEASEKTVGAVETLKDMYPYQIHEPQEDAFGMIILSKHPFKELKKLYFKGDIYNTWAARIVVHPPAMKAPVVIYGMHPLPPISPLYDKQRNLELHYLATHVANDQSSNKIMMGDWNVTPFAPVFREVLKSSGMNFQSYGLMLNPTWPTFLFLPFLQIPIDHALYSDNLIQLGKETAPGLMSDHKMLIARFTEK